MGAPRGPSDLGFARAKPVAIDGQAGSSKNDHEKVAIYAKTYSSNKPE